MVPANRKLVSVSSVLPTLSGPRANVKAGVAAILQGKAVAKANTTAPVAARPQGQAVMAMRTTTEATMKNRWAPMKVNIQ